MKKCTQTLLAGLASLVAAVVAVASAQAQEQPQADTALQAQIASAHRTPAFAARDAARHPYETLRFFGLKPTMTVVELSPGGGWYAEILAPYLRDKGQLILAGDDPAAEQAYLQRGAARMQQKLAASPALYDRTQVTVFAAGTGKLQYAAPASADLVLTFRNVHNWMALGEAKTQAVFKSAFDSLKVGGTLGLVEHRLPASAVQSPKADSGYVQQAYAIRMAESVGFKFTGASEVNANPKDKADHEGGVWALPPTFANKDKDRARYEVIGESDRMTLKFTKP